MSATSLIQLSLVGLVVVLGLASWDSGGRRLLLVTALVAAWFLSSHFEGALRFASFAGFSTVLAAALWSTKHQGLRRARPELLLGAGAVLAIFGSLLFAHGPIEVKIPLLVLTGFFVGAFVIVTVVRASQMLVHNRR